MRAMVLHASRQQLCAEQLPKPAPGPSQVLVSRFAPVESDQGRQVYAFTRDGDQKGQEFARKLGAICAGSSSTLPPDELDAAILFAPVGSLVPAYFGRSFGGAEPSYGQASKCATFLPFRMTCSGVNELFVRSPT
jgi:hypothetical protein